MEWCLDNMTLHNLLLQLDLRAYHGWAENKHFENLKNKNG